MRRKNKLFRSGVNSHMEIKWPPNRADIQKFCRMAHEAQGKHLLARHLGQTEISACLATSLQSRLSAASTFGTRAEAEAAVSHAFEHNASALSSWLSNGAQGRQVLNASWAGGTVLQRGASSAVPGTGVRVVLRGNGSGGYHTLTGFPTP